MVEMATRRFQGASSPVRKVPPHRDERRQDQREVHAGKQGHGTRAVDGRRLVQLRRDGPGIVSGHPEGVGGVMAAIRAQSLSSRL